MQIAQDTVVSIDYTLRDRNGDVIDSSEGHGPLAYLHGHNNIVAGLEKALEGHQAGDELSVNVPPEEGYGQYQEGLVQAVPMSAFEGVDQLAVGMQFQADSSQGPMVVTVREVRDDEVVVDGNHALADQQLDFSVAVVDVRSASSEELEHGHVHTADGYH